MMIDESKITRWAINAPTYEFEPLGELKLLKLIYFLMKENFTIDRKKSSAQDFYDFFNKDLRVACQQYVIFKKIIDEMFSYNVYTSDLKKDLGIGKPKEKKKPKAKAKPKKKKDIPAKPSNVVNFADFKKKSA